MIIWDKRNGYTYKDESTSKEYSLSELSCYHGEASHDIVAIWDNKNNCFANYVYGAEFLHKNIEELNNTIKLYVDDYEAQRNKQSKTKAFVKHEFTNAGITAFLDQASNDFFAEMEKPYEDQHLEKFDIMVSCGKHQIRIPLGAQEWDEVEAMLIECWEVNQ